MHPRKPLTRGEAQPLRQSHFADSAGMPIGIRSGFWISPRSRSLGTV